MTLKTKENCATIDYVLFIMNILIKHFEKFITKAQLLILWEFSYMKQIYSEILMIMIYLLEISTNSKNQLIRMSTKTILKKNQLRLAALHFFDDFQKHRESVNQSYLKWQLMFYQFLQWVLNLNKYFLKHVVQFHEKKCS